MPTNDFLPFALGVSPNVKTQAQWLAYAQRTSGFASGIADSAAFNKAIRQANTIANMIAQFSVDNAGLSMLDDGSMAEADLQAVFLNALQTSVGRIRLVANVTFYVSTTGNDTTGNGLSAGTAWATLQKAWDTIVLRYDLAGYTATVQVADGAYTTGLYACGVPVGMRSGLRNSAGALVPPIVFVGNVANPANCSITIASGICFQVGSGAALLIKGFKVSATGTTTDYLQAGVGIYAFDRAVLEFGWMDFGYCSHSHILASANCFVSSHGNPYAISGSALVAHVYVAESSAVALIGSTITFSNVCAFGNAFAYAYVFGYLGAWSMTFAGTYASALGPRYLADRLSLISTAGAGASYFPGNSAGSAPNGGQYY